MTEHRRQPGRPREIASPYRLNLYVESDLVSDLNRLARELSQEDGAPVSLAQSLATAVYESPRVRHLLPKPGKSGKSRWKLSAAIRKGTDIRPQGRPRTYFEKEPGTGSIVGSTALGAAWEGIGQEAAKLLTRDLYAAFPALQSERDSTCPAGGRCRNGRTLDAHIIHLEDRHGWTRDKVARWLERQGL